MVVGPATQTGPKTGNFVVFQSAVMGDMVCTTPVFRAIKEASPENKVFVVGRDWVKDILKDNPYVDGYISISADTSSLINQIKNIKPVFGCLVTPNFRGLAMLYLSGIPSIAAPHIEGFSPQQTRLYKALLRWVISVHYHFGRYAPRQYLNLLSPVDIKSDDTSKHLNYSASANHTVVEFLREKEIDVAKDFIVGISPSCGNKIKNWGGEKFAQVAQYAVRTHKAKVVIIGGPQDKEETGKMLASLSDSSGIVNASDKFNLDELKALISQFKLFIAVDTGPIYIAEAFNVPTIDILGPMDEREQPPVGPRNRLVYLKDRAEPVLHVFNARMYDRKEARRQIEEISPKMVIRELDSLVGVLG